MRNFYNPIPKLQGQVQESKVMSVLKDRIPVCEKTLGKKIHVMDF